jgi:hypothetical protein
MTYPTVNDVPLTDIFDPYVSGTKAIVTGYTVMVGGVPTDLRDLFAPIYLGTSAPITKYRVRGADLNTLFAAKGTAAYSLPINGKTYIESTLTRGTASVQFNMLASGAWNVTSFVSGRTPSTIVEDSGTWLPAGDSAANWSCSMINDGSGSVIAHGGFTGENTQTTTCPTARVLTSNQNAYQASSAITTGTRAQWTGTITLYLYRAGVLRSTTGIYLQLTADGF